MAKVVIDTNIFISAMMNPEGAPRQILRLAIQGKIEPLMGNGLFCEYEDVLKRDRLFKKGMLSAEEREALLNSIMAVSTWISIYSLWRPNLPDEADNHLIELAVAGGAEAIITQNKKDLGKGELLFPGLRVLNAGEFIRERKKQ